MKKYADYAGASISMSADALFTGTLDLLFREHAITHIFECGTFKGLGSTATLARIAQENNARIEQFITVEIDPDLYKEAKKNLEKFPFVTPLLGMTVDKAEARSFIENDEAINNHARYPDIFIDDVNDPKGFYLNELDGKLSGGQKKKKFFRKLLDELTAPKAENNILAKYLTPMADKTPVILLDSAGGVGFLEFQNVMSIMGDRPYFLILDDINHLKHFRSYRYIKDSAGFEVIAESIPNGWLIAQHV